MNNNFPVTAYSNLLLSLQLLGSCRRDLKFYVLLESFLFYSLLSQCNFCSSTLVLT
jgi:hypothetical protein